MTEGLLILHAITTLASAGNAAYFATMRPLGHRRCRSANILALVCGGTLAQSVVHGVSLWRGAEPPPETAALAQGMVALGSLAIALAVVQRLLVRLTGGKA